MIIEVPVPIAEIFDKISILEIKLSNVKDKDKLEYVKKELKLLIDKLQESNINYFLNNKLFISLKNINLKIWDLCNKRRIYNK